MTPYVDPNDEIIQEHLESGAIERQHELDELRHILKERYPVPESAIEDYHHKQVTLAELQLRFSPEEIEYIEEEVRERSNDKLSPSDVL